MSGLNFETLDNTQTNQTAVQAVTETQNSFKINPLDVVEVKEIVPVESQALSNLNQYKLKLREDGEVHNMLKEVNLSNSQSILAFGQKPTEEISRVSDDILNSMKQVTVEEASKMLTTLTKALSKFDVKELNIKAQEKQNFLQKLFNKVTATADELLKKYETMGKEVQDIHSHLKQYELDIQKTNSDLERQYKSTVKYIEQLEKYIVAGEMALEQIGEHKNVLANDSSLSEQQKAVKIEQLKNIEQIFEQRLYDLKLSENVAMQSCPMIMTIHQSNVNLLRKINGSISTTLPIFKNCLIQAVQLKRQEIAAKSIHEFDKFSNELMLRNAHATANQSKSIAQLTNSSAISIETLKQSYDIIQQGIRETQQIAEEERAKRRSNESELEKMKLEMRSKVGELI